MMIGMTGFGQSQLAKKNERFTLTLKSVNHRYFETQFHLPPGLDYLESLIRAKIQRKIKRGRLNISLSHINEASEVVVLNEKVAEKYFHLLDGMRRRLKMDGGISVASLVGLPGVIATRRQELASGERQMLIGRAVDEALKKLVDMRRQEGEAIAEDLRRRVENIAGHMATIKKLIAASAEESRRTMSPENLESFLRSTDVSEEVTRIEFHLKSFLRHMKLRDPKGKVLDFIGQELQREINTLGAKVQDKHAAYQVVMVKDQIEKIREQVQNVE